jgi:hypothetical protein
MKLPDFLPIQNQRVILSAWNIFYVVHFTRSLTNGLCLAFGRGPRMVDEGGRQNKMEEFLLWQVILLYL